jgi:L-glyceraldehyde 3-phosphate reductase
MLNRWIERGLLDTLEDLGIGCIGFSPLAQGMLTDKYIKGVPDDSRGAKGGSLKKEFLADKTLANVKALGAIAKKRGQTLAQMAIAWALRDPRVTSALIGARTVAQLDDSLDACKNLDFSEKELAEIDKYAVDADLNLWASSSNATAM